MGSYRPLFLFQIFFCVCVCLFCRLLSLVLCFHQNLGRLIDQIDRNWWPSPKSANTLAFITLNYGDNSSAVACYAEIIESIRNASEMTSRNIRCQLGFIYRPPERRVALQSESRPDEYPLLPTRIHRSKILKRRINNRYTDQYLPARNLQILPPLSLPYLPPTSPPPPPPIQWHPIKWNFSAQNDENPPD